MFYEILILLALVVFNFGLILLLVKLGKEFLYGYTMLTGGLIILLIPVNIEILGFPFALVEIFYASFFLITDIISELYGKKKAQKTLVYALFGMAVGLIFVKAALLMVPSEFDLGNSYLEIISGMFTPMALTIVVLAFMVEQYIDIYNYDKIKQWTNGGFLWLRNIASTATTQTIDVVVVYPVFFYPILGNDVWKLMLAAVVFKVLIALVDTPFMYLARSIGSKEG